MTIKDFILSRFQLFFFLTTLILAASSILGAVTAPEQNLHYYHLLSPIIIAALCVLPTCVTFFRKEPTPLQYIIRLIIELSIIEAVVLILISPPRESTMEPLQFYILLGVAVFIIYVLAALMMWWQKLRESKKLTSQLRKLQENE